LAVIIPEPDIVAVVLAEVELPKVIEPVLVQETKTSPEFGVAVIEREPESSQTLVPEGLVVPVPDGEAANVTWNWEM